MSKTLLTSLCYLDEPGRLQRNIKWLNYQIEHRLELRFDDLLLLDNASSKENIAELLGKVSSVTQNIGPIRRYDEFLPRTGIWEYPYCWRGLDTIKKEYLSQYDKIIFLDTDFYVLTPKLAHYIRDLKSGWEVFWCNKYGFPESSMHVLCKDAFHVLENFPIPSYTHYHGTPLENILPFTKINRDFTGDRYGETCDIQTPEMDYYGQHNGGCPDMIYDLKKQLELQASKA